MKNNNLCLFLIIFACCLTSCGGAKYTGPKEDVDMYWVLDNYGSQLASDQGLELLVVGNSTDSNQVCYCLMVRSKEKLMLSQGRKLGAELVRGFIQMLKSNPKVQEYVQYCQREFSSYPSELPLQKVGYRIEFWDDNANRPSKPYLAQIMFQNENFHYYEADPQTQELRLIYKESYNDALHYLNKQKS